MKLFNRKMKFSEYVVIPQRYILGLMGFLAIVNAYTMRVSLSVAIIEMVAPRNESSGAAASPDACSAPAAPGGGGAVTSPDRLYDWDERTQGLILSAFYWGYVATHLPGGVLAERFGGKHTLGLGMLSTALLTLATPWVIRASDGNWRVLVGLRMVEGLGEGTTYPALNALLAKWVPVGERAKMGTLVYAGGQIGTVVSNMISGTLIKRTQDWGSVFYLFGSLGVLWFVVWCLICYSEPNTHPFISEEELNYLNRELNYAQQEKQRPIPWRAILTSVPVWALVAAQIGHDWGFFTMVTDLPKYMKDVLKFDVEQSGAWSSIPYMVMWVVSMASGWLCDFLVQRGYFRITFARKFFTSIASLGPALFIIAASYSKCDRMLAVWMFTIAMGFMGTFYCGMKVNALDLSSNYAGTLMAIVNGCGAFTGIITPYLAGALTEHHSLAEWRYVFWITFVVFVIANTIYFFYGSGEEQWWNNHETVINNKSISNVESGMNLEKQKTHKKSIS